MKTLLELILTKWNFFLRFMLLIIMGLFLVLISIRIILGFVKPESIEFSTNAGNLSISLSNNSSSYEILNLPANIFWINTLTKLDSKRDLEITASGYISTYYDNPDTIISNTILKKDLVEYGRYYRMVWVDADGERQNGYKVNYAVNEDINDISYKLKLFQRSKYGSLIGFIIDQRVEDSIMQNNFLVEDKIELIDSLLAYNSELIKKFYIGKHCKITYNHLKGYFDVESSFPTIIDKRFNTSTLYFSVNDVVLKTADDIIIPSDIKFKDILINHRIFYKQGTSRSYVMVFR